VGIQRSLRFKSRPFLFLKLAHFYDKIYIAKKKKKKEKNSNSEITFEQAASFLEKYLLQKKKKYFFGKKIKRFKVFLARVKKRKLLSFFIFLEKKYLKKKNQRELVRLKFIEKESLRAKRKSQMKRFNFLNNFPFSFRNFFLRKKKKIFLLQKIMMKIGILLMRPLRQKE
jgi:hypothetical protein